MSFLPFHRHPIDFLPTFRRSLTEEDSMDRGMFELCVYFLDLRAVPDIRSLGGKTPNTRSGPCSLSGHSDLYLEKSERASLDSQEM
jgi:hypothetical protein